MQREARSFKADGLRCGASLLLDRQAYAANGGARLKAAKTRIRRATAAIGRRNVICRISQVPRPYGFGCSDADAPGEAPAHRLGALAREVGCDASTSRRCEGRPAERRCGGAPLPLPAGADPGQEDG